MISKAWATLNIMNRICKSKLSIRLKEMCSDLQSNPCLFRDWFCYLDSNNFFREQY